MKIFYIFFTQCVLALGYITQCPLGCEEPIYRDKKSIYFPFEWNHDKFSIQFDINDKSQCNCEFVPLKFNPMINDTDDISITISVNKNITIPNKWFDNYYKNNNIIELTIYSSNILNLTINTNSLFIKLIENYTSTLYQKGGLVNLPVNNTISNYNLKLNLNYNFINKIPSKFIKNQYLNEFYMQFNKIESISADAWEEIPYIIYILKTQLSISIINL